jgi:hypothetical protein
MRTTTNDSGPPAEQVEFLNQPANGRQLVKHLGESDRAHSETPIRSGLPPVVALWLPPCDISMSPPVAVITGAFGKRTPDTVSLSQRTVDGITRHLPAGCHRQDGA